MSASASWVIPVVIGLVALGWAGWLWMLVEVLSWPASTWTATGLQKSRWVLRVLILGWIGALLYLVRVRADLRAAYAATRRVSTS